MDPLLCTGLVAALKQHCDIDTLVDGLEEPGPPEAAIDVVITDYPEAMRLTSPAARRAGSYPEARILILTADDREADIRRAIEAGVHGYLLLGGPVIELVEAVTVVGRGLRYFCQAVAQRMADSLTRAPLTSREIEVLRLVATGRPNKGIARELDIEVGTVKSHMSAIMTKLGASTRTEAASIAAARGLVAEWVATGAGGLGADEIGRSHMPSARSSRPLGGGWRQHA
jgi:two-component system NarL family response regulator